MYWCFVSKSCRALYGRQSLASQNFTKEIIPPYFSVKEAVFPFAKFPGVDPILGPEMKSTGEVMGVGKTFGEAFHKAVLGSNDKLPTGGCAFISVRDSDKTLLPQLGRDLVELGFSIGGHRWQPKNLGSSRCTV
jgi:carbamoyl-phosphate synthase large subunit